MTLGPRPPLALALPAIAGALLLLAQPASAQLEPAKGENLERAQKAADAVFHWIKLNADKGATRQGAAPAPAPTPAPAPAPVAKKAAPAPAPVAAGPKPAPAPVAANTAPTTAPAPTTAAVAAPPAVTTAAAQPEPEPERTPVVVASAAPTPAPAAPMATAAQAVQPPPPPQEEAEEPLKLLAKVNPTLPRQMAQQASFRTGFAQVQFTVSPDGTVKQASVIKASHARLGTAAVDAVLSGASRRSASRVKQRSKSPSAATANDRLELIPVS